MREALSDLVGLGCLDGQYDLPVLGLVLELCCGALGIDPEEADASPDVIAGLIGEDRARRAVWRWILGVDSSDVHAKVKIRNLRLALRELRKFYEDDEFEAEP